VGGNERGRGRGRVVEMNDTRADQADERTHLTKMLLQLT
jgi:hypothetical protein